MRTFRAQHGLRKVSVFRGGESADVCIQPHSDLLLYRRSQLHATPTHAEPDGYTFYVNVKCCTISTLQYDHIAEAEIVVNADDDAIKRNAQAD